MRFSYRIQTKLCLFATIFIFSFKNPTPEKEEAFIKFAITNHFNSFAINFLTDSLNKRTQLKAIRLLHGESGEKADIFCDSVMAIRYKNRNIPYRLNLDANLNYESFMAFCKKNNLDPVKMARELK